MRDTKIWGSSKPPEDGTTKDLLNYAGKRASPPNVEQTLLELLTEVGSDRMKECQDAVKRFSGRPHLFHYGAEGVRMTEIEARSLVLATADSL
jgi:hypothetical protein